VRAANADTPFADTGKNGITDTFSKVLTALTGLAKAVDRLGIGVCLCQVTGQANE
jgi:hypothetical protein